MLAAALFGRQTNLKLKTFGAANLGLTTLSKPRLNIIRKYVKLRQLSQHYFTLLLSVRTLNVIKLSVNMLSISMLSAVLQSNLLLNVIELNVVIPSVLAP